MSTTHSHTQISSNQADPSGTSGIESDYIDATVGWYEHLRDTITPASFNRPTGNEISTNQNFEDPPQVYEFETREDKVRKFLTWLESQQQAGLLSVVNRNNNVYIERAYAEGIDHAEQALQDRGIEVENLPGIYALPVHAQTVQDLFERNFEQFEDVTEDQAQRIRETLTEGFTQGRNPRDIARNLKEDIDHVGKYRSELIARTEIINAHSEATLRRFEQIGVEEVGIEAEWVTAGDLQVCPICQALAGKTYTTDEIRNTNFRFSPPEDSDHRSLAGMYPKKPPAHPQCRCVLVPAV